MLTRKQKMLLHTVPGKLGLEPEQRKTIQRTIGGFSSAADRGATHEGFCAIMAFYEQRAGGQLEAAEKGYWQHAHDRNQQRKAAGDSGNDRLIFLIRNTATRMGWSEADIEHFLHSDHCSSGQYARLDQANNYWLSRCLSGLQAIGKRQGATENALP